MNNGQNNQQAYDRGSSIFSPDGRLYQVEYAREAVSRGSPSVGVCTSEGVVLAAECRVRSPLMKRESVEKLHRVDDGIGIASAGHVADARNLIDTARRQGQLNELRYADGIEVETLTKAITDHIQQYTQSGGTRPFGVSLLIGGIDDGVPRLFEADPSGTPYQWDATAIGDKSQDIQQYLDENYEDGMSLDEGIEMALSALAVRTEEFIEGSASVAVIPTDTEQYRTLEMDDVDEYLEDLDLLAEDDDA